MADRAWHDYILLILSESFEWLENSIFKWTLFAGWSVAVVGVKNRKLSAAKLIHCARTSPSDAPTLKLSKTSTDFQLVCQLQLQRLIHKQGSRSCSISSIFSDSSLWTDMPDIFDAWQSASSRWGCDQNLTSKHAKKLRSNCAIQCWLNNKNFLWQPLSKQFEGKEKGQESTRQTANQAISTSKMFSTGGNKAKPRHPLSVCADCGASSPSWASVSRGVLICADCASVHRSLGRHISHVKCLNQGSWIPEQLRMVQSLYSCGANRCVLF